MNYKVIGLIAAIMTAAVSHSAWSATQSTNDAPAKHAVTASSITWHGYNKAIFSAAKANSKYILVFAMSGTCHWCKQMESMTFTSPDIVKLVNENFYPVMLHADKDADAAAKYNLSSVPAIIILDSSGKVVASYNGYMEVPAMKQHLMDNVQH